MRGIERIKRATYTAGIALMLIMTITLVFGIGAARAQPLSAPDPTSRAQNLDDAPNPPADTGLAQAPAALPTIKVGLFMRPPFAMKQGEHYTGMAVELWEVTASRMGLNFTYRPYEKISDILQATAAGEIDVAVSNFTISSARLKRLDFTQPWYDSGMRIMIKENRSANIIDRLEKTGHLRNYAWLALFFVFATITLTLVDRRVDKRFPRRWLRGLSESFFHVVSATSTGKTSHKPILGTFGRVFSAFWILGGVGFVAYITSSITSTMVTTSLIHEINDRTDLAKKTVGVQIGSVAENYAQMLALNIRHYRNTDEAITDLLEEEIDAIIDDAPVLEYYDNAHPELPLAVVGGMVRPEKYGFALPRGSKLTQPLTIQLLELHETGLLDKLSVKYFGTTR